jgi:hypothetical protein
VLLERAVQPDAPVRRAAHQRDAPARAVHLQLIDAVGRAGGQAKTTVDALIQLAAEIGWLRRSMWDMPAIMEFRSLICKESLSFLHSFFTAFRHPVGI